LTTSGEGQFTVHKPVAPSTGGSHNNAHFPLSSTTTHDTKTSSGVTPAGPPLLSGHEDDYDYEDEDDYEYEYEYEYEDDYVNNNMTTSSTVDSLSVRPTESPIIVGIREELLRVYGKPPPPGNPLRLRWDPATGAVAQTLEAGYKLKTLVLQQFLEDNEANLQPYVFNDIMGLDRNGQMTKKKGKYWVSGPSMVAGAVINKFDPNQPITQGFSLAAPGSEFRPRIGAFAGGEEDSDGYGVNNNNDNENSYSVVWHGACNCGFIKEALDQCISTMLMCDIFPRSEQVRRANPCAPSSTYGVEIGTMDCVIFACSFPSFGDACDALRHTIASLNDGGVLIVTNVEGHDKPAMDACFKGCKRYQDRELGNVIRTTVEVEDQRSVDLIIFTRKGKDNVPEIELEQRKLVPVYVAEPSVPADKAPSVNITSKKVFMQAALDNKKSIIGCPGCYLIEVKCDGASVCYGGSSLNVTTRSDTHLRGNGNRGIANAISSLTLSQVPAQARSTAVLCLGEVDIGWIKLFCGGTDPTVTAVDFLLRFVEQHMLSNMMNMEHNGTLGNYKLLNFFISGFSRGVKANASINGKTCFLFFNRPPPP
jgi:hypothetical protein